MHKKIVILNFLLLNNICQAEIPKNFLIEEDFKDLIITPEQIIPSANQYSYPTFILSNDASKSFPLKIEIEKIARAQNIALNGSKFFDTTDICNSTLTHDNLIKQGAQEIIITTEDGISLSCTYLDRKKDKVVLVGPGFTNAKEKMAPLAYTYLNYDVMLMNFRGHGYKKKTFNPLVYFLNIDQNTRLGAEEEKDVFAVIKYLRNISGKYYREIIGQGICFGSLVFARAQGIKEYNGEILFDKLVLDGCWHSLDLFKEKIINDPFLIIDPQRGGAPKSLKLLFGQRWFNKSIQKFLELLWHVNFKDVNVIDYLKQIKIPVLFFYGKDDKTIYRNEFEDIWNATVSTQKIACITSNEHVWNHLKQKEFYKLLCELFIETKDVNKILKLLDNQDELLKYLFNQFEDIAEDMPNENIFKPVKKSIPEWKKKLPSRTTVKITIGILVAAGIYMGYKQGILTPKKAQELLNNVKPWLNPKNYNSKKS